MPKQATGSQTLADPAAAALWEKAIEAKGGRSKLYAVSNILESNVDKREVSLYVFPGKRWEWSDWVYLSVAMDNPELNLSYNVVEDSPFATRNWGGTHAKEALWPNYYAQLYYLLETQWIKPLPVKVFNGKFDDRQIDVIQTIVYFRNAPRAKERGSLVDFHLDKRTHLPMKVAFPSNDSVGTNYGLGTWYVTFSDYADVDGIQMPRKVGYDEKPRKRLPIRVNVDYDPSIFEQLPSFKAGPDAWRPKGIAESR